MVVRFLYEELNDTKTMNLNTIYLCKKKYLQNADSPAFIWTSGENLINGRKFPKFVGKNVILGGDE